MGWGSNVCNAIVRIDTLRIAAGKRKNTSLASYPKISSESLPRDGYEYRCFSMAGFGHQGARCALYTGTMGVYHTPPHVSVLGGNIEDDCYLQLVTLPRAHDWGPELCDVKLIVAGMRCGYCGSGYLLVCFFTSSLSDIRCRSVLSCTSISSLGSLSRGRDSFSAASSYFFVLISRAFKRGRGHRL